MKRFFASLLVCLAVLTAVAQQAGMSKLSPWLRQLVREHTMNSCKVFSPATQQRPGEVCAFVRITEEDNALWQQYGCHPLTKVGTVHIACIPISQLKAFAADARVSRVEARPVGETLCDSMPIHLNALPVYAGTDLSQAFTGKDVVVGVMDIGFDLTHPNFYSSDLSQYRVKRLWDMLSTDTIGSRFPVGRDYTTEQELLALQHSRDGKDMTHGTYTAGIAAGSGYTSPYRGMAPESDLCFVANAVTDNVSYIDTADYHKFTFATDALGFKYMFDYAQSVHKPCVISFSEGSGQDFRGYDQLYYEMLDSLVGPGRILVSAAGNRGRVKDWFCKERGTPSKGTFLYSATRSSTLTFKSRDPFTMRVVAYGGKNDTVMVHTDKILAEKDSLYSDTIIVEGREFVVQIEAYPSCYDSNETCYDVTLLNEAPPLGGPFAVSLEAVGVDAVVEAFRQNGYFISHVRNPELNAGECVYGVLSPSSAPSVICVGATAYRTSIVNHAGERKEFVDGRNGERAGMSSVGPTYDGRIKPDVMAPGINVISSYSSFYIAQHPEADDASYNLYYYDFRGRTYAWNCNSGTSASAPAVAGVIALWLQACPTLTPQQAMEAIIHTSRQHDTSLTYPNNLYGYGEIDAYRGLLYLLKADAIKGVSTSPTAVRVRLTEEGQLRLSLPQEASSPFTVSVYTLSGKSVAHHWCSSGSSGYELSVPSLQRGNVYVVQIDGKADVMGSMLIRKR